MSGMFESEDKERVHYPYYIVFGWEAVPFKRGEEDRLIANNIIRNY